MDNNNTIKQEDKIQWTLFEVILKMSDGSICKFVSSMPAPNIEKAKILAIDNSWKYKVVDILNVKFFDSIKEEPIKD